MKVFRAVNLQNYSQWLMPIKVLSTVLISGAIGLELWNLYTHGFDRFESWMPIVWFERFALVAHGLEGIVSAFLAPAKGEKPIPYGVYTFFVGTIGLLELFDRQLDSPH
ncbi:MAG: hypothetical protein WBB29_11055 [Geitlerinemataceae cyanobacterium]